MKVATGRPLTNRVSIAVEKAGLIPRLIPFRDIDYPWRLNQPFHQALDQSA